MMNKTILIMSVLVSVLNVRALEYQPPQVRVTIRVVDEDEQPVPGAKLNLGFPGVGPQNLPPEDLSVADAEGVFSLSARSIGPIRGFAFADGFYGTSFDFDHSWQVPAGVTVRRRWPEVRYRVMIRPIVNPVPMYAYRFFGTVPVEGEEVGFDFLKADWMPPHGGGETADVLVQVVTHNRMERAGGEYSWRFPRDGDGMIRVNMDRFYEESEFRDDPRKRDVGRQISEFRMPCREAPEDGYIPRWRAEAGQYGHVTDMEPSGPGLNAVPYYFRIRTELGDQGQVLQAMYGKIVSSEGRGVVFRFADPGREAALEFTYYINPDGTRNTEFDPEQNLFMGVLEDRWFPEFP